MRMKVTPRLRNGKKLSQQEIQQATPVSGELMVVQSQSDEMNRMATVAQFQTMGGIERQPLPPLIDATISWMGPNGMVLSGYEIVNGIAYAQSWWCRLQD